jgi:hypothetical protein
MVVWCGCGAERRLGEGAVTEGDAQRALLALVVRCSDLLYLDARLDRSSRRRIVAVNAEVVWLRRCRHALLPLYQPSIKSLSRLW